MGQELKQELRLAQKLVLTPQLQQSIKLLQLTRMELLEHINQELTENPMLEEVTEKNEDESEDDRIINEIIADDNFGGYTTSFGEGTYGLDEDDKQNFIENTCTKKISLLDHLLWQYKMGAATDEEIGLCAAIAGNLNEDGYLALSVEEIAQREKKDVGLVEEALRKVQLLDPVGVAARDLAECLTIQAKHYRIENPIVFLIIKDLLPKLQNKNYPFIAKQLGVSVDEVIKAVEVITHFDPKPGSVFFEDDPIYIVPDIYIYKIDDEYIIRLNENGLPKLSINNFYRNILKNKGEVASGTKDFIKERIKSATWLIKSIYQRQQTIYNVTKSIVEHQRDFLDKGVQYLKPLILKEIADKVGVHESTVSRVTSGKYAYTPRGIFELKYFFTGRAHTNQGEEKSVESVKNRIQVLISKENPHRPLSDQKIVRILEKEGTIVARRTVAKYRELMGILSSAQRKCM